mgnify:CR=1 FL=1
MNWISIRINHGKSHESAAGSPRGGALLFYVLGMRSHAAATFVAGPAQVTAYKEIAYVEFVEAVPKSAAGKILRKELRQMEEQRRMQRARL